MANSNDESRIPAALNYLRKHHHFFEFDDQERVVKVGVSDAANVDEVAAHIGSLRDLQELTLYRTGLSDRALRDLADLVSLKELHVDGSGFTSAGLAYLDSMSALEDLYLGDARDLDLAAFTCIARVPSLRELTMRGGSFSDADLAPLGALVNLEKFSLSECKEVHGTFCKYLTQLSRLRHLSLGEIDGQVTDEGLVSVSQLPALVELYLEGPFTDSGLKRLTRLKQLTTLSIHSDYVTAEGITFVAELSQLENLWLDTPRLADDCIPTLLRCLALESMRFTRSALSDAGLQSLRDGLPKCEVKDSQRDPHEFGPWVNTTNEDRIQFESTTPFPTLLAEASDWDLVNSTFVKIGDRYNHWVDATQYSPEERVIMLVWHSSGIIGHGGFEYLFAGEFPGDPDYRITAEAYKAAGLLRGYEAFQEAFALFPGGKIPHDQAERERLYDAANRSARQRLNRKLWQDEYDHSREKKLAEFIRTHANQLGDLDTPWLC